METILQAAFAGFTFFIVLSIRELVKISNSKKS